MSKFSKIDIPVTEFSFTFARSGGAGGQNINKVNSKATLYWSLEHSPSCSSAVKERFKARYSQMVSLEGMVQIVSQKHRTQKANIDDCIAKLHALLDSVAVAPKVRKATKPKRGAVERRLQSKKKDSDKKKLRRGVL
ncbi:MAG: aminoacyl-tRNA hydrolase [Oligoflexia bacterium]|nr:aminoacyl-tRNA hydrolase [Oligoflexia bacterium]MBF0364664.1 aminoacyl-tRNA hydrolase [Oligoflexia bacterium]